MGSTPTLCPNSTRLGRWNRLVKEEGTKELGEMVGRGQELAKETVGRTADKVTGPAKVKEEGKKEVGEMVGRGRELANYVIEVMGLPETWSSLMGVVNLLGFATAYGMSVWVTFVSSYVLAGALPRQQFGIVQSKIHPVYFRSMAYGIGMALLGHLLSQRKKLFSSKADMFQCYNLLASLLIVLTNFMYLEPRATKVMFERMKMEKEEGRGRDIGEHPATTTTPTVAEPQQERPEQREVVRARIRRLSERLKKLNTYSSFLNIFTLMSLTWHLVNLGQRLHVTC